IEQHGPRGGAPLHGQRHESGTSSPVTALAAGEQRNVTTAATCSRSTYRVSGLISFKFVAVRMALGASAFARTPFARSSAAMARISVATPVFAIVYADVLAPVLPGRAACDENNTIAPRASRIAGRKARVVRNAVVRLIAI